TRETAIDSAFSIHSHKPETPPVLSLPIPHKGRPTECSTRHELPEIKLTSHQTA
ncbi:hypothetical protein ASPFODRAFT_104618, partial [Aspergillus luchuensis CBS 106.47]